MAIFSCFVLSYRCVRCDHRGGSRMISEVVRFDQITVLYKKTGLSKQYSPNQTPQNAASDQGLHCLLLIQQFYAYS